LRQWPGRSPIKMPTSTPIAVASGRSRVGGYGRGKAVHPDMAARHGEAAIYLEDLSVANVTEGALF